MECQSENDYESKKVGTVGEKPPQLHIGIRRDDRRRDKSSHTFMKVWSRKIWISSGFCCVKSNRKLHTPDFFPLPVEKKKKEKKGKPSFETPLNFYMQKVGKRV